MLGNLISALVDTLFEAAVAAVVKFFQLEDAVELAGALFGLACIVIGVLTVWPGR